MNIDPANPADPDRDRFVLSKGHACAGGNAAKYVRNGCKDEESGKTITIKIEAD